MIGFDHEQIAVFSTCSYIRLAYFENQKINIAIKRKIIIAIKAASMCF